MDRLTAMTSFVRVVERGSFAAAGGSLGLSAPMVGNHVRFLEARLGALLLNRTTRRQRLTEFGHAYYERCRHILGAIEAAEAFADEMRAVPLGLLRVTAPLVLGTTILPGLLAEYLRLNPQVRIDLVLQDRRIDLLGEGMDAAIRAGTLPDSGLIARTLAPLQLVVCAAPAYLAARGRPATPTDLAAHECLDFAHAAEPGLWRFRGPDKEIAVAITGRLRINNGQALRLAALDGAGIVMQPEIMVAGDIAEGHLVRLLADHAAPRLELHLVTLPDRHSTPKLRSFVEFIVAHFGVASGR